MTPHTAGAMSIKHVFLYNAGNTSKGENCDRLVTCEFNVSAQSTKLSKIFTNLFITRYNICGQRESCPHPASDLWGLFTWCQGDLCRKDSSELLKWEDAMIIQVTWTVSMIKWSSHLVNEQFQFQMDNLNSDFCKAQWIAKNITMLFNSYKWDYWYKISRPSCSKHR